MDYEKFRYETDKFENYMKKFRKENPELTSDSNDQVNSPKHYTSGKQEAIDTIEDAIISAPSVKSGFLQGQVLKYMLRLWHKKNSKEDAQKAKWYLDRLIDSLD